MAKQAMAKQAMPVVDKYELTPLMRAATEENAIPLLVKMLMNDKIRETLFATDRKGRTALDWSRMCRNFHAVSLLTKAMSVSISDARLNEISAAVDVALHLRATNKSQSSRLLKAIQHRDGFTALRIINENMLYREEVEALKQDTTETKSNFFVDAVTTSGYSPLMLASGMNMRDVVEALLHLGANKEHANKFGHTAYTFACAGGNSDIVRILLFNGANDRHQSNEGRTGLHYACLYAKARTVKTIMTFKLEQFSSFRIAGHSMIDFDPSRWSVYAKEMEAFLDIRDNHDKRAIDLIGKALAPANFATTANTSSAASDVFSLAASLSSSISDLPPTPLETAKEIELRLRLSRVKGLPKLKLKATSSNDEDDDDNRSTAVERDYAGDMDNEDDDEFSDERKTDRTETDRGSERGETFDFGDDIWQLDGLDGADLAWEQGKGSRHSVGQQENFLEDWENLDEEDDDSDARLRTDTGTHQGDGGQNDANLVLCGVCSPPNSGRRIGKPANVTAATAPSSSSSSSRSITDHDMSKPVSQTGSRRGKSATATAAPSSSSSSSSSRVSHDDYMSNPGSQSGSQRSKITTATANTAPSSSSGRFMPDDDDDDALVAGSKSGSRRGDFASRGLVPAVRAVEDVEAFDRAQADFLGGMSSQIPRRGGKNDSAPGGKSGTFSVGGNSSSRTSSLRSMSNQYDGSLRSLKTGEFSHDTDNLHAEGHNGIRDAFSIATALPVKEEIGIIRNAFQGCRDHLERWYSAADKERELMVLLPCHLGCGHMCRVEELTPHVRDDCVNRSITCSQCSRLIASHSLKEHKIKTCLKRVVGCPNGYKGCLEMCTYEKVDLHMNTKCKVRPMVCRQLCGVMIPMKARESHEMQHCVNRELVCDQCKTVTMKAHRYSHHLKNECENRTVQCRLSCGLKMKAKDLDRHEEEVCKQLCRWNCGLNTGPPEILRLHELTACLRRPAKCKYGCDPAKHVLSAATVEQHEKYVCALKPELCPNGCGTQLSRSDVMSHVDSWSGSCPERLVRCPSNLVNWRVTVLPSPEEGIVMKYNRKKVLQGFSNKGDFADIDQVCMLL
jgi:ankyrin repeat protein